MNLVVTGGSFFKKAAEETKDGGIRSLGLEYKYAGWERSIIINMTRENTRVIRIGERVIGGGNPVLIQSMTNTRTEDIKGTVEQIHKLEKAGCEIIRCTVPTPEAAAAIGEIKKQISIPLVADIHFDLSLIHI